MNVPVRYNNQIKRLNKAKHEPLYLLDYLYIKRQKFEFNFRI